jgi:hypothetical protein
MPDFRTIAGFTGVLAPQPHRRVKEMCIRNDPGILGDGECVVESHPLITVPDIDFDFDSTIKGNDLAGCSL